MTALSSDPATLLSAYQNSEKIDLSHPLVEGMPVWPGHPVFCHDLLSTHDNGACYHGLELGEHTGTHLDAPLHFVRGGWAIDAMPVEHFVSRMVVQDYRDLPGGIVTADMIRERETVIPIEAGDAVFLHFGWDRKWYEDLDGFLVGWPGLDEGAAQYLAERKVMLVGCDCLSIDAASSTSYAAHRTLLGAGILVGENFNNLGKVGALATLAAFPLPIAGGSGSPLRAVAIR